MKYDWNLSLLCNEDDTWKQQYDELKNKIMVINNETEHLLDNINLYVAGSEELEAVIKENEELIKHDTLAKKVVYHEERDNYTTTNINGNNLDIDIEKV